MVRVRVRVRVPVSLVSPDPNPNPNPNQAVTIRGNAAQVKRAQAALEAVLKYDAESNAVLVVDAAMMPLLIGKGGEEINRIRSVTGAAIDAERDEKKPQFKLRGSKEAVEAARPNPNP